MTDLDLRPSPRPPRLLRLLARLLIRGGVASYIVSDLDASFGRDLERGLGRGRAIWRYAQNVLGSTWSVWTSGRRGPRRAAWHRHARQATAHYTSRPEARGPDAREVSGPHHCRRSCDGVRDLRRHYHLRARDVGRLSHAAAARGRAHRPDPELGRRVQSSRAARAVRLRCLARCAAVGDRARCLEGRRPHPDRRRWRVASRRGRGDHRLRLSRRRGCASPGPRPRCDRRADGCATRGRARVRRVADALRERPRCDRPHRAARKRARGRWSA